VKLYCSLFIVRSATVGLSFFLKFVVIAFLSMQNTMNIIIIIVLSIDRIQTVW